jgi:O-antigen ligase
LLARARELDRTAAAGSARRAFPVALVFAAVGWTALENGGFFASSWGWPTLAFLVTGMTVAIGSGRLTLARLDLLALGALVAFVCWTAISALWSPGAELPIQASELGLLYLTALAAFLALGSTALPLGVLAGVVPIAGYALLTRLLPDHVGRYDPSVGGYLLAGTTGYQNCLGVLCALAALIALGVVAHERRLPARVLAAVLLIVLLPTLYFTFSRGAAAVLVLGLVCALALDSRRLRLAAVALCSLPLPLLGVWLGSRSAPLTRAGASLSAAARDGHRLLAALVVLGVVQAAAVVLLARVERRMVVTARIRRAFARTLAAALAVSLALVPLRVGNPASFVSHATDAFQSEHPASGGDLNRRLVTLSGHTRAQYWAVASREVRENPLLGGGGGTFRRYWLRYRPAPIDVLNAHNLYLETLAELGPAGLLLLVGVLATPLAALRRARRRPLIPIVAGAYIAALAHAAIDWDWQLPATTISTLALGATLLVAGRRSPAERPFARRLAVAIIPIGIALIAFVFVAQIGNDALDAAERAANRGDYSAALAHARTARAWLVWAASPWRQIGEAQLARGEPAAAASSLREALRRDDSDWSAWLDLGLASGGRQRRQALARAARLNPRSQALASLGPRSGARG